MNKTILSGSLSGSIQIIPSKSAAHRAVIMSALCRQASSRIFPIQLSADIQATLSCCRALGLIESYKTEQTDHPGQCRVNLSSSVPNYSAIRERILDCGESGSTLRFMIPLALDGKGPVTFVGHGRLMQRPLSVYESLFKKSGFVWKQKENSLTVEGKLMPGDYTLPGDVSSQFVTGLLLALPLLEDDSRILLASPLQSSAYAELTRQLQQSFGIHSFWKDSRTLTIPGKQRYVSPENMVVEGDWSHAAFYLTAGLLSRRSTVEVIGLKPDSIQADRSILTILRSMGGQIEEKADGSFIAYPSVLHAAEVDCSQYPDIVPILAVAMAFAEGQSRIFGAARLRLKESDRLNAMKNALNAVGVECSETPDGLEITGTKQIHDSIIEGTNDHRIVMAMAIAAARSDSPLTITDAESVAKSAPFFWDEYRNLGGLTK